MPSLSMVYDILAVDRASAVFDHVGGRAVAAGRDIEGASSKIGTAMKAVATGAAIGGAAFAVAAVKMAADFNSQMLLVQTQAGATSAEVRKMTPAILSLAGQTAQAPEALATSMYHAYSVTKNMAQSLDIVRSAAKLATISHSDLEQTTNALTAAVASNIPGVHNMNDAIAMLNATVGAGDMKMTDLNEAMGSGLLTVVKGYGLSMRDVSAALATFGDNNIRGANAATMLRMAVQAMAVPVKAGDSILKALGVSAGQTDQALAKYGITSKKLATDMQTGGLNKAVTDLRDHLEAAGVKGDQVGEILTTAFGKKAGPGVAVLLSQFDRLQQKYGSVDEATHTFGAEWDATTKSAAFQMTALKDSVEAMTIQFGNYLMPAVTAGLGWINGTGIPAIKGFAGGVGDAVHWFSQLPGPVKAAAEAMAGLALANAIGLFTKLGNGIVYARVLMLEFSGVAKGSMATVAASYRGAAAAAGELAAVQGSAGLKSAVSGIAGLGAAAGTSAKIGFGALRSAAGGLINFLGGPWVVGIAAAAGAVYLINKSIEDHAKQVQLATADVQKWQEALALGSGGQIRDAASHINDLTAKIAALQEKIDAYNAAAKGGNARGGVGTLISQMKDLQKELNGGTDAWNKQFAAMTPVQEGQAKVALATEEVNKALKSGNADQIAAAYAALARANTYLAGETNKDAEAQKSANQQLQDAATLAIGARDAALGYKLSQLDLKDAIKQVAQGQADGSLTGDALTKAQLQLAKQVEDTAKMAGDAAVAQAQQNGVTETGTLRTQAMIDVLREQAKHLSGPALDAVNGYISDLSKMTADTTTGTKAMTTLGITVDKLPVGHFIKIEAPTEKQMKDLHDLAYMTLTLPDGHVIVSADVHPAEAEIRDMINAYRTQVIDLRAQMPALPGTSQRMGTYATGGYTGDGGKYTPAGIVHAGEFVFPQESVSKLGVGFLGALAGLPGYASGGYAPNGTMPVGWIRPSVHMDTSPVAAELAALLAPLKAALAGPGAPANVSGNAAVVQRVAGNYGWGSGAEWGALYNVIMRESGFRNTAQNPTSTAYGMFQFLDSTWAGYGVSKTSDPLFQAVAGLAYIKQRYGDPLGAWRHEQSMGWYKDGTNFVPSDGPAYLHRGEAVVPASKNQGAPYRDGPMVVNIYDVDNRLIGTMDGRIVEFAGVQTNASRYGG